MCNLGHDVLSKILVRYRNSKAICRGTRGVYKLSVARVGERHGRVICCGAITTQSFPTDQAVSLR